ncbi:MAG: MaoC family dehydratase [Chloroflexota bacterium]|nr:MaoC family dehydratase [Chloroflexota bacterium]
MDSKEHDKKISYSELEIGTIVSKQSYVLDRESVQKYILAVEDSTFSTVAESSNIAPPMSIAALSLRGVVNDLNIPGGTLHIGQELSFLKTVPVGIYLECEAVLSSNSVRGDFRFMVVDLSVRDDVKEPVMKGKSTIMLPVDISN